MKFNCDFFNKIILDFKFNLTSRAYRADRRAEAKRKDLSKPHDWFAWYPVKLGWGDCRWLETVTRFGDAWFDSRRNKWVMNYKYQANRDE